MIRWGIIGAGNIAKKFAETVNTVEDSKLYAVSNRSLDKAIKFKENYPCEIAYGSYQEIIDDKNIDAVYVSLPHGLHYEWSIKALNAGKAVLCEKPATVNYKQMEEIANLSREKKVFYMEAMKGRFTPAYKSMRKMIDDGEIGKIKSIKASLCRVFEYEDNKRLFDTDEGGCMLDMGVYNIGFIEDFVSYPYSLIDITYKTNDIVELYVNARLKADNILIDIESAFDRNKEAVAIIKGEKGKIIAEDFHRISKFILEKEGNSKVYDIPYSFNDFYGEIQHATECIRDGLWESPIMSHQSSKNVAKIMKIVKNEISVV